MKLEINGVMHHYEVRGNGMETILFIHGLGGNCNFWYPQLLPLSRHYKVISYDLRGSSRSGVGDSLYSMQGWVEDIIALLDHLGADSVHVVSHSMGTLIAQHFAIAYPNRCSSLALVGPIIEIGEAGKAGLRKRAESVRDNGMIAVCDQITEAGLSSYTKGAKPEVVGLIRDMLLNQPDEGYARSCEALANAKAIQHHEVSVPVLLIAGDEDATSPYSVSRTLAKSFKNATVNCIPHSGHWQALENPGAVIKGLLDFYATF